MKLYLRLACSQKHQKCKFVPRLLFMIVVPVLYRKYECGLLNLGQRNYLLDIFYLNSCGYRKIPLIICGVFLGL